STIRQPWLWLSVGLLLSPLSWMSYDMVLYPLVLLYLNSRSRLHLLSGLGVVSVWVVLPLFWFAKIGIDFGFMAAVTRIMLLAVVSMSKSIGHLYTDRFRAARSLTGSQ
ncbi:MAG TPA: hypothetical protein VJ935_00135, partial [Acidimicrobiia bacterium]|nr:hypothetical protein [Acidimicrobiia bacterium]